MTGGTHFHQNLRAGNNYTIAINHEPSHRQVNK